VEELRKQLAAVRAHYAELADRIQRCELRAAENHMQVMDSAEKVAKRLSERERKRKPVEDDEDEEELQLDPWLRRS